MNEIHNIKYEGIEFTVFGDYESPDDTTGYKGGFSVCSVKVNECDIIWMLKPIVIDRITDIINEIR
jgi:hypothetical protein